MKTCKQINNGARTPAIGATEAMQVDDVIVSIPTLNCIDIDYERTQIIKDTFSSSYCASAGAIEWPATGCIATQNLRVGCAKATTNHNNNYVNAKFHSEANFSDVFPLTLLICRRRSRRLTSPQRRSSPRPGTRPSVRRRNPVTSANNHSLFVKLTPLRTAFHYFYRRRAPQCAVDRVTSCLTSSARLPTRCV
ncbi:hypothetical protein EVAR_7404_1 [Eumeta japonica]|uniref:Uncharacterized protein n=1 Tax=Eumeta variegata TaxID=151549 RepID=A0A4C1V7R8_EUMVA|nr:hypothetical protein EVAR_7404_1 [Eumeta japonica]